jgi:MinD-like ATPase involved in chromosome partitioning or flagellar assembly
MTRRQLLQLSGKVRRHDQCICGKKSLTSPLSVPAPNTGVYELVLDADLRVAVIRDFFDPQEVSAQMGDFLEDVRDQWDTTTTTPSPAAAQVGLEGSGSDGGDHDEL